MRFVAALAVVAGHAVGMVWVPPGGGVAFEPWSATVSVLTGFGPQAVTVFFVLSGFWITQSAVRRLGGEHFWREFLTDRLTRLHIVVVPALALGAALDLLGAGVFHGAVYWGALGLQCLGDGVYNHLTPAAFVTNVAFLQGFAADQFGTNGPLWSIAFEFWFYVWFAALAVSIMRRRPSPALLALALGLFWPALAYLFPVWLMGSAVYYADRWRMRRDVAGEPWARIVLPVAVAAMAAALTGVRLDILHGALAELLVGLAFSLLLWGLLRSAVAFPRWLAPLARYGAAASFSLYVTHYPLFAFVLSAIGHDTRRMPDLAGFALILGLCLVAVVVGWLFSRLTEAHTPWLRRMIRLQPHAAARG